MPGPLKLVAQVLSQARQGGTWHELNDPTRDQCLQWCHDGRVQRWLVVSSQAALERAEASVTKAQQREGATLEQQLFHVHATRLKTPEAAPAALAVRAHSWRYHPVDPTGVIEPKRDAGTGRPTPTSPLTSIDWQRRVQARPEQERIAWRKPQGACLVIGTTIDASHVRDIQVIQAYTAQSQVESGLRLLKDPSFFVASLFVKKPCRMQGLLRVMTLALLGYAVTQRRLRGQLVRQHETLPHQINQPTERPTLRWVFPLLAGMHRVRMTLQDQAHDLIEGRNEVQIKVLRLFGEEVCQMYQIAPG